MFSINNKRKDFSKSMKSRLYEILEATRGKDDRTAVWANTFLYSIIILNVIAVIFETLEPLQIKYSQVFKWIDVISVMIFTVEYLLRLWTCTENRLFKRKFTGRLKYAITPMALVDLLAILPFYLPLFPGVDLRILRLLRLFRMTRIMKLARYSKALKMIKDAFNDKREELLVTITLLGVILIIAASMMYFAEHEAQPQAFSSIPAAMWWGIVTLTTVGYGDVYPVTTLGKFFGAIIALLAIGLVALPTGIISAGMVEQMKQGKEKQKCPHCGRDIL